MNELHLFAGAGGGILGGMLLGHTCVCAVEIEPYCRKVLLQRQRDGILPRFPIWDDVRTFDGKPWRGLVDVVCGGFPCQDISVAGKGKGIEGERSGLWAEFARIIGEVQPRYIFVENSPLLTKRGLGRALGDLSEMGYDAEWGVLGADDVGAPHHRKRMWILAHSRYGCRREYYEGYAERICDKRNCKEKEWECGPVETFRSSEGAEIMAFQRTNTTWWEFDPANAERAVESGMGRVANGVAHRVDRIKALGNGQVPLVAATAWPMLIKRLKGGIK